MEIISFATDLASPGQRRARVGAPLPGTRYLLDFERAYSGERPADRIAWLDMDGPWFGAARDTYDRLVADPSFVERAAAEGWLVERDGASILAPVPRPGKIVCIGLNYRDHAAELKMAVPERPIVFSKFTTAVIAPHDPIVIPPESAKVDYEAELAVIVGRRAKRVSSARAIDYVLGYTVFNDVTARDFQSVDGQWQRSKSCDTFAPMGPAIVDAAAVRDPHALGIRLTVNGTTMQESNTDQLIFGVSELIEFVSATVTLEPGDVIATGTPPGVGAGRTPPVFLRPGDVVEVEIDGVGRLTNPVVGG
jgi:2-keto-4-pentenoate hydratase/2-oxohepta-3-ene-1,7-dioic acid hydratase in catechol pathway